MIVTLDDARREALIKQAFEIMCLTTSRYERQFAWDAMRELVKGRSAAQVRAMEQRKGLR